MKKILMKIILYFACIFVAAYYLYIFYLGCNKNVPLEYEVFFSEEYDLKLWPGTNGLTFDLGSTEYYTSDKMIRRLNNNWEEDDDGITTSGKGELYYHFNSEESILYITCTFASIDNCEQLKILINSKNIEYTINENVICLELDNSELNDVYTLTFDGTPVTLESVYISEEN